MIGKLAVVMTVYNEKLRHLMSSVESTLNSLRCIELSKLIIYVDNDDEHIDFFVMKYLKEVNDRYSEVEVFFSNKNIGLANSLNYVIQELCSGYEYIGRMDADDICLATRFSLQMKKMYCGFDVVGSNGIKIDENDNIIGLIEKSECPDFRFGNDMIHPSIIFRRKCYDLVEGYRSYPAAQDYDFLCRAKSLGMKMMNIDESLIQYRIRDDSIGQKNKKIQVMYKVSISKSFRSGMILSEELCLDLKKYKFYDFVEDNCRSNIYIYRLASLMSVLHFKNYLLNIFKRFL